MRGRITGGLLALVLTLFVTAAAGCAGPSTAHLAGPTAAHTPLPVGQSAGRLTVDGRSRDYRVYRPASLPTKAPLVVMLHGGFGSATQAESAYGWDRRADSGHFVVLYPDGLDHAWNSGGDCCGVPARQNVDDVAFVAHLVAALGHQVPLDPGRLYVTGISNGGMMAYRLACQPRLFAAAGVDSACPAAPAAG